MVDKLNQLTNKLKSLQLTVLLAEDEGISQLVFKKLTDNINCKTLIADDGKQAIALLEKTQFDIIFLDLHLPFFSGYEIIDQIKHESSVNINTPIVLVSATASAEEMKKALEKGFDKLLIKPFSPAQLYATINDFCSTKFDIEFDPNSSIDLSMIKSLYNNEQVLIDSLIITIKLELMKNLSKMEDPTFFDDIYLIRDFIHKIRPSFSYLGLQDVAEQLLQLEKKIESGVPVNNIEEVCQNIAFITKKTLEDLK